MPCIRTSIAITIQNNEIVLPGKPKKMDELEKELQKSASKPPKVEATPPLNPESVVGSDEKDPKGKKWGFDMYPERRGEKYKPSWGKTLATIEGRENTDRIKCERNIYNCVMKSPLVKIMMGALSASGW